MRRKRLIWLVVGGGTAVLLAGIVLAVMFATGVMGQLPSNGRLEGAIKIPELDLPPPTSLADLADDYPQIAALLSDPELGTVYKEFLIAYDTGGMGAAEKLAGERGLLTPDGEHLRVTLVLDTEDSAALVAQLEAVGVNVVSAYKDRVNIAVAVDLIESAIGADDAGLVFAQLTELEHVVAVRMPDTRRGEVRPVMPEPASQQPYRGEGVDVVGAAAWHQVGFKGEGVRIGVLDLGFYGYQALLGTALPAQVEIETFGWVDDEEVHGAACAEIVHELAPEAELFFAWYDGSDAALGEAVSWLMDQDVDIITHSAGSVLSPRDGTGWDARLVDEIVGQGVLWVNSAGNEADVHYRDEFRDEDGNGYHEFRSGQELLPIYVEGDLHVYLMWQESWSAPQQDYELYVLDADGTVLASSENPQDGSQGQEPAEYVILQTNEPVVYATVFNYNSDRSVVFDLFVHGPGAWIEGASPEYSVNSPGDALGALTVGAVDWDTDLLAFYSSQGPTTDERLKPDISGPTGVSGYTYGRHGFPGTSASTPHVAGVAALVWQAYPAFTRQQVTEYLLSAVDDLGPQGPDTGYGFGRLRLPAPPQAVIGPTSTPAAATEQDPVTRTPAPLVTPTPFAYVTPGPVLAEDEQGLGKTVLLVVLLIGGLGLGGGGLLLVGGVLLVVDLRGRRATTSVAAPSNLQAPEGRSPLSFDARSRQAPPPSSEPQARVDKARQLGVVPRELPDTQRQMESRSGHAGAALAGQASMPEDVGTPEDAGTPEGARPCSSCGTHLQAGRLFCPHCGASAEQARLCHRCGSPLRAESRFCPKCGTPVQERS